MNRQAWDEMKLARDGHTSALKPIPGGEGLWPRFEVIECHEDGEPSHWVAKYGHTDPGCVVFCSKRYAKSHGLIGDSPQEETCE